MIKKAYQRFCKVEEWIAAALLLNIMGLVFLSALARTAGYPLNWAVDISLLFFAWLVFLGGDIIIRNTNLIGVDIFLRKMPAGVQRGLHGVFAVMMILFLAVLVAYGVPLCIENKKRLFQATNLSYSWCSLSVPVGAFLMIISTSIRLRELFTRQKGL